MRWAGAGFGFLCRRERVIGLQMLLLSAFDLYRVCPMFRSFAWLNGLVVSALGIGDPGSIPGSRHSQYYSG